MIALIQQLIERLRAFFLPQQYYAWQTIIYLCLFSWVMSWVAVAAGASGFTRFLLTAFSWIFLAIGLGWALEANRIRPFGLVIAPWVVGAVLCLFIFGSWPGNQWALALVSWPLISVVVVIIPKFIDWDFTLQIPPPPERQRLILLGLIGLLLSSWFQFYFRLQTWLDDYPSLLAEELHRSGFVYRFPGQDVPLSRGVSLLTAAEASLKEELNGTPWSWVERWLLNLDEQLRQLDNAARERVVLPQKEAPLWHLVAPPPEGKDEGYTLTLMAVWMGPAAESQGYYLQKTCQILPQATITASDQETAIDPAPDDPIPLVARVECELGTPRSPGLPPVRDNTESI